MTTREPSRRALPAARGFRPKSAPVAKLNMADVTWTAFLDDLAERWRLESPARKQDRSRRREHEIVQAALRVFARDGIARARISDVAAEAGMPLSSIYEYCPSKEDLAYAVPLTQLASFYREYSERGRNVETARERLRLYLWMAADFARRHPEWARTLYLEVWPSVLVAEARVRTGLDEYASIIVQLLRAGDAAGEWVSGPDHYETATIFIGGLNQLIITWLMYRRPRHVSRAAASLVDRVLSSLLPPIGVAQAPGRPSGRPAPVPRKAPARTRPRAKPESRAGDAAE